jgi:hypothetical protein
MPGIQHPVSAWFPTLKRFVFACAGVAAVLMLAPQRADALSLASPVAAQLSAKYASGGAIEVRHGGGGHGFHGGGFRGGGFHGGGFRGVHGGFHRGGFYRGGFIGRPHVWAGHRPYWRGRHFAHRRFVGGYYPYAYGPRCRVIWTYHGPRRICHWHHRHWHRRGWW